MCMSGGRLGHVVYAIRDEPQLREINNVVIVAGNNDITTSYQNNNQFAYGIEKGLDKLLFKGNELTLEKIVTLVQPHQEADPQTKLRAKYIEQIYKATPHVLFIPHQEIQQDDTGHPSNEETSTRCSILTMDARHQL